MSGPTDGPLVGTWDSLCQVFKNNSKLGWPFTPPHTKTISLSLSVNLPVLCAHSCLRVRDSSGFHVICRHQRATVHDGGTRRTSCTIAVSGVPNIFKPQAAIVQTLWLTIWFIVVYWCLLVSTGFNFSKVLSTKTQPLNIGELKRVNANVVWHLTLFFLDNNLYAALEISQMICIIKQNKLVLQKKIEV